LLAALGRLEGSSVAVRVVEPGDPEILAVVLRGELGPARQDRPPTLFWPVQEGAPLLPEEVEEPGIYLQREHFGGAVARAGATILVISQGPMIVNVRRV
jgi:hypothetical protein